MADIFPRTVRRGPIEWGEILYEPEPEVARQDMDMDRAFRFFFLLNLSSLFVGGISFLIIEVTEDFLIMAVITISIFCLLLIPMHYSEGPYAV